MRSRTRKKLLWVFFMIAILFVIFYMTYYLFILRMEAGADEQFSAYIKENIIMQITFGGLVSVAVLIAAALILDTLISKNKQV